MRQILTFLTPIIFIVNGAWAQNDTLLFEDFQADTLDYIYAEPPNGNDTTWLNFDADGFADQSSLNATNWLQTNGFASADTANLVFASSSWTSPIGQTANYLILPPLQIIDNEAMLYWKSASFQTPLYLDGYCIVVSTAGNSEVEFTDTILKYAEYVSILNDPLPDTTFSNFEFSAGFVSGSDGQYIEYDGDSLRFLGELRPDSFSLAQYAGQRIYIAFIHTSLDDNLLSLDDILVKGSAPSGIYAPPAGFNVSVTPNPASESTRLNVSLSYPTSLKLKILDIHGRKVVTLETQKLNNGRHSVEISTTGLAPGVYTILCETEYRSFTEKLIIQ